MKNRGFTLIEMAIVIAITGLLMSAFLQYYTIQLEKAHYDTTRARMKELRTALTIYSATHERLPCPASPRGMFDDQKRKEFRGDDKDIDYCAPDAEPPEGLVTYTGGVQAQDKSKEVWIGVIPIRELRLSVEQGQDGWGNEFTYAVSRRLSLPHGMNGNPIPLGTITINDENGKNVLDVPHSGRYVIISHGPSGAGAWTQQGGRKPCNAGTEDYENCNDDDTFMMAAFSRKLGPTFFDDIVIHDDPDAGGTLLDHLATCNMKQAFYQPADPRADKDGCLASLNVWQGACVQSTTLDENGQFQQHAPIMILAPAAASKTECSCEKGYRSVEVGAWDDGTTSIGEDQQKSSLRFTDPQGNPVSGLVPLGPNAKTDAKQITNTRTALYTCVRGN